MTIENAYVSFLPHWYRAARKGVLIAMFGRNLQGMGWEDPSYIQRAAKAGKLVGAAMRLNVTPPGRTASACALPARTRSTSGAAAVRWSDPASGERQVHLCRTRGAPRQA